VLFFDSAKQETELDQLRKEERLVKVACPSFVSCLFLLISLPFCAFFKWWNWNFLKLCVIRHDVMCLPIVCHSNGVGHV